jgi:hypothetical protein
MALRTQLKCVLILITILNVSFNTQYQGCLIHMFKKYGRKYDIYFLPKIDLIFNLLIGLLNNNACSMLNQMYRRLCMVGLPKFSTFEHLAMWLRVLFSETRSNDPTPFIRFLDTLHVVIYSR